MKKNLVLILALSFCLTGCSNNNSTDNQEENNNYSSSRIISSENINSNTINTDNTNIINNTINNINAEEELSSFSTKIYTPDDEARQNNIKITCSTLNGTIVKPGETFSFCDTVGKATPEKGYQKADIFDKNGNVTKGYGGGNCQISSTLYNALLSLSDIEIVERHEHSKKVYYVPDR